MLSRLFVRHRFKVFHTAVTGCPQGRENLAVPRCNAKRGFANVHMGHRHQSKIIIKRPALPQCIQRRDQFSHGERRRNTIFRVGGMCCPAFKVRSAYSITS